MAWTRLHRGLRRLLLVVSAGLAAGAWAQFSHLPARERNLTALLSPTGAHDARSFVLSDGAAAVTVLALQDRQILASRSYDSGGFLSFPTVVAGAPYDSFGVKQFEVARGPGQTVYLAYVAENNPGTMIRTRTSTDLGATWGPEVAISTPTAGGRSVRDVEIASSGNMVAVLFLGNAGYDPFVSVSTDAGIGFSVPVRLDAGVPARRFAAPSAAVAVTPGGTISAAFVQDRDGNQTDEADVWVTRSTDGGLTFSAETSVQPANHLLSANVDLAVANDGGVLLTFWDYQEFAGPPVVEYHVYVYRSTNGGSTYLGVGNFLQPTGTGIALKPRVAVATAPSGTALLRYVDATFQLRVHRSTDHGASWGAGTTLVATASQTTQIPVIHTAAGWLVAWSDVRTDTYDGRSTDAYYRVSTTDGVSWLPEVTLGVAPQESRVESLADAGDPGGGRRVYLSYLDAGASGGRDLDVKGGRVLVATGALDFERRDMADLEMGLRPSAAPGAAVAADGNRVVEAFAATSPSARTNVYVARSTDGGYSFLPPVRVGSTALGSRIEGEPRIAIVPGGAVHLVFSSDTGPNREIRYTRSLDGGATWSPDQVLGTVVGWQAGLTGNRQFPAVQLVAQGSGVWVAWSDSFSVMLARSTNGGASFSVADVDQDGTQTARAPSLCVAGNRVVLATTASTGFPLYLWSVWGLVSEDGGATWGTRTQLRAGAVGGYALFPVAACHATAPPVVVYLDFRNVVDGELRSTIYQTPGAWSTDVAVAAPANLVPGLHDVAYLANGNAVVLFPDLVTGRLWRTAAFTPGAFTNLAAVDDLIPNPAGLSLNPHIATSGTDVFFTWLDQANGWPNLVSMVLNDDLDVAGRGAMRIDSAQPEGAWDGSVPPPPTGGVVAASAGRAHYAWTSQRLSGDAEVLYNVYDPGDLDHDGIAAGVDCNDFDPGVYFAPTVVQNLLVSDMGGTFLNWSSQSASAGPDTRYDVVRGTLSSLRATGGYGSATCLWNGFGGNVFQDPAPDPPPGDGFWYFVRAENVCGVGSYGVPDLDAASPCP